MKMIRTTQPYRSEGTLLYLKSFFEGEARENDKGFHKIAGTKGKDIHQGEDREAVSGFGWKRWNRGISVPESCASMIGIIILDVKSAGKPYEGKPHVRFDVAGDGKVLRRT
ncbi:MAG: hypothetical protein IT420_14290 [Candidatus Brocadia sp.]|nr:hypothetical protein [Candidatus Brocadia sp.]MDG5995802.1 hypothetical protein [Candidatus Brocadia sp.]